MSSPTPVRLLQLLLGTVGTLSQFGGASSAEQHRQARHTYPSPEPTLEPTSIAAPVNFNSVPISFDAESGDGGGGDVTTSSSITNNDDAKKSASSPVANPTSSPATITSDITTDAVMDDGTLIGDQRDDASQSEETNASAAPIHAPVYALRHGRGIFAVTGGTGCYEGARGQAQGRFGIKTSRVDLFVPAITWIFDDIIDTELGPQDTVWEKVSDDGRRLHGFEARTEHEKTSTSTTPPTSKSDEAVRHHRKLYSRTRQCDMFRKGVDSFNIMSLKLEQRINPTGNRNVMESRSAYHEHGSFLAKEQWYTGVQGEYSLSCLHHECKLSLYFGAMDSSSTMERRNLFTNDDDGDNHRVMTFLSLQGTTELAYQGPDTEMLVCVDNCDVGSKVEVDAEHYEPINLRSFDNTHSLVHVDSGKGKGSSAKGTKAPKASKGTTSGTSSECLVPVSAATRSRRRHLKSSKGSITTSKGTTHATSKGSKGSKGTTYINAPFGTLCTGGACANGACLPNLCVGTVCDVPDGNTCETTPGFCDPATGLCVYTDVADGTVCDDGNIATVSDTCQNGACVGADPCDIANCAAGQVCAINGMNGVCEDPDPAPVNPCTGETCLPDVNLCQMNGVCSLDNNGSPLCFYNEATDGTLCDDGNPDTIGDACSAGICVGENRCDGVTCNSPNPDPCQIDPGICNPSDGSCIYSFVPDGTPCDDSDSTTCNDQCVSGACTGTADLNACCAEANGSLFEPRTAATNTGCGVTCGTDGGCCAATYNVIDGATGPNGAANLGDNCCPSGVLMCPDGSTGSQVTCCYGTLIGGLPCNDDGSCPPFVPNSIPVPAPLADDPNVFCAKAPGSEFSPSTSLVGAGCGVACDFPSGSRGCCGTKHDSTDPTVPGNGQNRFSDNCCPADRLMCGDTGDTECCYGTALAGGSCAGSNGQFCP